MKLLMLSPHRFTRAEEVSEDKSRSISSSTVALGSSCLPWKEGTGGTMLFPPLHKSLTGTAGRKKNSNTAWEKVSQHKDGALENWEWQAKETSLIKS